MRPTRLIAAGIYDAILAHELRCICKEVVAQYSMHHAARTEGHRATYSGGPQFESRPTDWLSLTNNMSCLFLTSVSLSPSHTLFTILQVLVNVLLHVSTENGRVRSNCIRNIALGV